MRHLVRAACATALALAPSFGVGASAQAFESISSYDVQIEIRADDSIRIAETIVYDFGSSEHHGIYRDVPTRLYYDDRSDRVYPLHVESVSASPGTPAQYDVSSEAGGISRIKIGDPDRTITGAHTYQIVYTVGAALNGFADHDELYWNAIGDEWDVPVSNAEVTVTAPAGILQVACAAGPSGSYQACDRAKAKDDTARFAQASLNPYEALTIMVSVSKGVVAEPHPQLVERWSIDRAFSRRPATLGFSGLLLLAIAGGFGWLLWARGRDRRYVGSPVDQVMGSPGG